jgi:prefoldin subunit 5|tara:strand:+ start:501 stop:635 length:135 start_codon:yes stop_codon:yes gene_type:complete
MEIKINDLQKRIHQLDQDIGEKENECQKLREELTMVKEQSEILT